MHRLATILLAAPLLLASASAQTGRQVRTLPASIPGGLTLPIHLEHAIRSGRTPAGTPVRARLTQRVPIAEHAFLPPNTELLGTVLASTPTTLTLRFDRLRLAGQTLPIATSALAAANFVAVAETTIPCAGAVDRANPDAANWTTCQVGGDQVVRSGWSGPVLNDRTQTVGFADYDGVYGNPPTPGALPHALGVFSPEARGLFGYGPDVTLASTADTFTLHSARPVTLHAEDNLLLRISTTGNPEPEARNAACQRPAAAIAPSAGPTPKTIYP